MDAKKLDSIISEFEESVEGVKRLKDIYGIIEERNRELNEINVSIKKQYELNTEIAKKYNDFKKECENTFERFNRDQREFQLQLGSKLERIESDIQVEMRKNTKQIEDGIGTMIDGLNELQVKTSDAQKRQTILNGVIIALVVISIVLPIFI